MKRPPLPRWLIASCAVLVMAGLYWGLNQAEARAIYARWDKLLHAAVFFLIWWLMRWSLPGQVSWLWVSLICIIGGAAEEVHQAFSPQHTADWRDVLANIFGVSLAAMIYVIGRLLWLLRASVNERHAAPAVARDEVSQWRVHPLDLRWTFRFWRWEAYVVIVGGHERRALSPQEQNLARWSTWFLIFVFLIASTAISAAVLMVIKTALGV